MAKHGPQTRYQYTRKAADRLAASQRKRCTTKTPQGHAGVFAWLPPGVALARTAEAGRLLVAARAFGKGDVVFVEAALLSVAAPDDYTDEADDAVHLGLWEREVDAFDALDAVGRRACSRCTRRRRRRGSRRCSRSLASAPPRRRAEAAAAAAHLLGQRAGGGRPLPAAGDGLVDRARLRRERGARGERMPAASNSSPCGRLRAARR